MPAVQARISAVDFYLPEQVLTNDELATAFPEWTSQKILGKTGIAERRAAQEGQCASDLAVEAARNLFRRGACDPANVDYLLYCTQSPDYFLPTTACLLQDRLGLRKSTGALDFNLGCSGFIYGLSLAKGLIETGQAHSVLLITAETYSKFIQPSDQSTRTLFGDAAAATLITSAQEDETLPWIGPFVFGTDGHGGPNLIVRGGAMREPTCPATLYMSGPEIFNFTLRAVPDAVARLLAISERTLADIDLFVFHQANQFMLDHLRRKIGIPEEKFCLALRDCGNTVSSTIPIALRSASASGKLQPGHRVMLVGFGVGYSWGATLIHWAETR